MSSKACEISKKKVEDILKAPFSISMTPMFRGECYALPWITPLYPKYVLYNAEI